MNIIATRSLLFLLIWVTLIFLGSCGRPDNFQPKGALAFSDDSVKFDTIFTTVRSATQRLYIYNNTGNNMLIERVFIDQGKDSKFSMILDGVAGNDQSNIELAKGDSLIAFFTMDAKTDQGDYNLTDILNFQIGSTTQKITLFARVLDAYIFRDTVIKQHSAFKWPMDKPVVVDGYVLVDSLATLKIPAGAQIFFSARRDRNFNFFSQIFSRGTLIVNEEDGQPVLMTSFRINKDYNEQAGQWQGIRISRLSSGNYINKTIIKNCVIGIQADSFAIDLQPKCVIKNCIIRNCSNFGILGLGSLTGIAPTSAPIIRAYNSIVENVGQSAAAMFFGGQYDFYHCTFYNSRNITFNRTQPVFGFQNYTQTASGAIDQVFPGRLIMQNCIVWGTNEEEFAFSVAGQGLVRANVTHNIIQTKLDPSRLPGENLVNVNPRFKDDTKNDFNIQENSNARNKGLSLDRLDALSEVISELQRDHAGNARKRDQPDIGALEFKQ